MSTPDRRGSWRKPLKSRASRKIPRKSPHNFTGQLTFGEDRGKPQCLQFESKLEHDAALLMIYRPDTADVEEQLEPIPFNDLSGRPRKHTLDFRWTSVFGVRIAVTVKPEDKVHARFLDEVSRVRRVAVPKVADRMMLVTEREIDPARLARAKLFHAARHPEPRTDEVLAAHIAELTETRPMRGLLRDAGLGDAGYHSAVRMIRGGLLEAQSGPITLSSPVWKGERSA